jgi:chromosome segregation ATPase
MLGELSQNLILISAGVFLLGWILSSIGSRLNDRLRARRRDPRDDRIRSLDAELRIAQGEAEKAKERMKSMEEELKEANDGILKRDSVISHQQLKIDQVSYDLKESVKKTRELRGELTERATESVRSEVKLREVETELEVAQASTDLIATGVLDYSFSEDEDDDQDVAGAGSRTR